MQESFGNFDLIHHNDVLGFADIKVSRWRSRVTGLTVIHLDYEAPIVKGYFALPTEIFDDSGCPHTLEHLIFAGSENYPYKGIVARFANRGFANGLNAWTAHDHTCYTVKTAGGQGFLQILPIFVDHILYPTLTKEAFLTEVHHIDPQGHDAGVVYCEMQGRQNGAGDLMELARQRLLYPEDSGYRRETGGLMENLRVLSLDQIRDYHAQYYVPHNLALIVGGKFLGGTEELLSVVDKEVEPTIVAHGQNRGVRPPGWRRPFLETPSASRKPFVESRFVDVHFPEKDESMGRLILNFTGPAPDQHLQRKALDLLGTYLTSSPVAPLNKEYVEIENPLCSSFGFYDVDGPTLVDLRIYIGSVPADRLLDFDSKLKESFRKIIRDGIDMDRMKMVVDRDERRVCDTNSIAEEGASAQVSPVENMPEWIQNALQANPSFALAEKGIKKLRSRLEAVKGDAYSGTVITDFMLGPSDGSGLLGALDDMSLYPLLSKWTSDEWTSLLQKYYVDPPCVVVRGIPSAALADKLKVDEEKRLEEQVKALGPEKLSRAKEELEAALAKNEEPIPDEVIKSFSLPDVHSIAWIPIQSVQESTGKDTICKRTDDEPLKKHIDSDGSTLPFFVEFDHVQPEFFTILVVLSLADIPQDLKPLMTIYLSAFFELPVQCSDGQKLSYEQVIAKLDDETVAYSASFGIQGNFEETFVISITAQTKMYENTVRWAKDLLCGAEFDITRLRTICAKIMQDIPERKRDGRNILASVESEMIYAKNSMTRASSLLSNAESVAEVVQRLKDDPEGVQNNFELMRKHLTNPAGIRFAVTGNILSLDAPRSALSKHFGEKLPPTPLKPLTPSNQMLSELGREPKSSAVVVSLPTIESSFVTHSAKAINGFQHPDYPAVQLAIEVLNAFEGFLWRAIRGMGLSYGAKLSCNLESGLLSFNLYRSSNSIRAFQEGAKVVQGLANGTIPLEDTAVDAGKSTLVYNLTSAVSTPGEAAMSSFVNQALKGVRKDFHLELLEKFQAVTTEEVLAAIRKYVLPVFDPKLSIVVSVTAPGKVGETVDGLKEIGFEVETREIHGEVEGLDGLTGPAA